MLLLIISLLSAYKGLKLLKFSPFKFLISRLLSAYKGLKHEKWEIETNKDKSLLSAYKGLKLTTLWRKMEGGSLFIKCL